MDWDKEFPVGSQLLVNLKAALGDVSVLLFESSDICPEKGQSFASVHSHGDTGGGHDGHETIEEVMACLAGKVLPSSRSLKRKNVVIPSVSEQTVGHTRGYNHTREGSHGFMNAHPFSFVFLGSLLGFQDTPDASNSGGCRYPVEPAGCNGVG